MLRKALKKKNLHHPGPDRTPHELRGAGVVSFARHLPRSTPCGVHGRRQGGSSSLGLKTL